MEATHAEDPCDVEKMVGVADANLGVDGVDETRKRRRNRTQDSEDRAPVLRVTTR